MLTSDLPLPAFPLGRTRNAPMTSLVVVVAISLGTAVIFLILKCVNLIASRIVRNAPKGAGLVEISLMKADGMEVILQHEKYSGKIFININGQDEEIFHLPHVTWRMRTVFLPKKVKGIDRMEIIRPLVMAPTSSGWTYIITCGGKRIEEVR